MEHLSARGRFSLAVRMYQYTGLSAEGHRHYPLRAVKVLRRSAATLLPLCPFLDEWGGVVAQLEESHEVLAALVSGCQKVQGQQGYYRAIAGMRAASSGAFDRAAARMPNAAQRLLRDAELRKIDRRAARFLRIHDAQARPHGAGNVQREGLSEDARSRVQPGGRRIH